MFLYLLALLAGFVILIYGANFLVDGGAALAHRLKVSSIVIGLTVVAFGTSTPELVVNVLSSVKGSSALALGNVLGSNIFNILAILGITALIVPLGVKKSTTWVEVPLTVLAAVMILVLANGAPTATITRAEGFCLLCFFAVFLGYTLFLAQKGHMSQDEEVKIKPYNTPKSVGFILLGLVGLIAGGQLLVKGAVGLAQMAGISERIIGLTIVSIGTSLPELATSLIAARKKNADMAIGNVVGSNIFNTFLILGTSSVVAPMQISSDSLTDLWLNIIASLLLFLFIFTGQGRKINRWEGAIFVVLYLIYLITLILDRPLFPF